MRQFKSLMDYEIFANHIIYHYRYHFDDDINDFLQTVLETARNRITTLRPEEVLWRAQKSDVREMRLLTETVSEEDPEFDIEEPPPEDVEWPCLAPFSPERMKPLKFSAVEGRVNPKGISYLYLSDDLDTAMAETRPFVGETLTLAEFRVDRELKIVDCGMCTQSFDGYETRHDEIEKEIWRLISFGFSRPVERKDDSAGYAPTQVLGELFRKSGFDGIKFKSGLGKGQNIALFDLATAQVVGDCMLYRTKNVSFSFERETQLYDFDAPPFD